MNTNKHTPKPWRVDKYGVVTGGPDGATSVCETYLAKWRDRSTYGRKIQSDHLEQFALEAEANGRLIAAAPELLEALEALLDEHRIMNAKLRRIGRGHTEDGSDPYCPAVLAEDAIAKATGQH